MVYTLHYHPGVAEDDLPDMPANVRQRLARAIEERLTTNPQRYGVPLRRSLKGYWKLRVGDYRVVYSINKDVITIEKVRHRRDVYK